MVSLLTASLLQCPKWTPEVYKMDTVLRRSIKVNSETKTPWDDERRCDLPCEFPDCRTCENRILPMGYSTEYSEEFEQWLNERD